MVLANVTVQVVAAQTVPCRWILKQVAQIAESPSSPINPDSLRFALNLTRKHDLCNRDATRETRIQLLGYRVYLLDALHLYAEAEAVVEMFFTDLTGTADPAMRARFHAWRSRYQARKGAWHEAIHSFHKCRNGLGALPLRQRVEVLLQGAKLHLQVNDVNTVLALTEEAIQLLENPSAQNTVLKQAYAEALHLNGRTCLKQNPSAPDPTKLGMTVDRLHTAAEIYRQQEDEHNLCLTLTTLGEAYVAQGDTMVGVTFLTQAVKRAVSHNEPRAAVFAYAQRGKVYLSANRLKEAERDLQLSWQLAEEHDTRDYTLDILETLGTVYEQQHQVKKAMETYERAVTLAAEADGPEARLRVQSALLRIRRAQEPLSFSLLWFLVLVFLVGLGYRLALHRSVQHEKPRPPVKGLSPESPPAPPPLPTIPDLTARRIAYLWLLCFRPDQVERYVHDYDPALVEKLRSEDPGLQQQHRVILESLYAVEQALGPPDREELSNPYKAMLAHLRSFFQEDRWGELPRGVYGWRLFFVERGWDDVPPDWILQHHRKLD